MHHLHKEIVSWSHTFPRLHELYLLDPSNPENYFNHQSFKKVLLREPPEPSLCALEKDLHRLDDIAWEDFKVKSSSYLSVKDKYGWATQLFDLFNEVKGYCYLRDLGCTVIAFLSERDKPGEETPDFYGRHEAGLFLMEVKTIYESDDNNDYLTRRGAYRTEKSARTVQNSMNHALRIKIEKTLSKAARQLNSEALRRSEEVKHKIIFLNIWFDTQFATSQTADDLGNFLNEICPAGCEVVHRIANTIYLDT